MMNTTMSALGYIASGLATFFIAFTALIPIFGAFIGCAVGVFLIFMVSPKQAVLFIIIFLLLQQIEGNLIYPHVVGGSVGLPSIWVLAAVTIGGNLMGIVGMQHRKYIPDRHFHNVHSRHTYDIQIFSYNLQLYVIP